jgi:hypothetical protein
MTETDRVLPKRVAWPRFDVVVTRWTGESRARYCVVDHLTRAARFPLDPFDRDLARALCTRLVQEATDKGEETTVLRAKEATVSPPRPKRERPKLPSQGRSPEATPPEKATKGGQP